MKYLFWSSLVTCSRSFSYVPQFTHLWGSHSLAGWCQQELLNRQGWVWSSGICFGGCVTLGKSLNLVLLSFPLCPMGNNAYALGCCVWHAGTLLLMRMAWQSHLSLEWKRRELSSFSFPHWSCAECHIDTMLSISTEVHCSPDTYLPQKDLKLLAATTCFKDVCFFFFFLMTKLPLSNNVNNFRKKISFLNYIVQ